MSTPDFVMDYEAMHQAANQLGTLKGDIDTLQGNGGGNTVSGFNVEPDFAVAQGSDSDMGDAAATEALMGFLQAWNKPLNDAGTQITNLQSTLDGVSKFFFDADAAQASAINFSLLSSNIDQYYQNQADYQQQVNQFAAQNAEYYQNTDVLPGTPPPGNTSGPGNGAATGGEVPPIAPIAPTDPQPSSTFVGNSGAITNVSTNGVDATGKPVITSETTTYTDGNGLTYTETTNFGPVTSVDNGAPVQASTQSIQHSDGSTDAVTVTPNVATGATTTVDVNTSSDKKTTTTTSTSPNKAGGN
jgi:hypothetical protein